MVMSAQNEHSRTRFCTDNVVHNAGTFHKFFQWVQIHRFFNKGARWHGWTIHPPPCYSHTSGVSHDGLLKRNFRAVCKRSNHVWLLFPFFRKGFLSCRVTVWVMKSFYITTQNRFYSDALNKPVKVHYYTWLVTVCVSNHNAGLICIYL